MAHGQKPGFFILPFGIDGEAVGYGFWERSQLSEHWLAVCNDFLNAHGIAFEDSWTGTLSHIQTKMTSASGTALVSLSVRGKVVLSILLLSGLSPAAEKATTEIFVDSLKRSAPVQAAAQSPNPFGNIFSADDRPLMIVVPWPEATVSEQDHEIVRELGLHLAGAFFAAAQ